LPERRVWKPFGSGKLLERGDWKPERAESTFIRPEHA
jgi:hypothetical protein